MNQKNLLLCIILILAALPCFAMDWPTFVQLTIDHNIELQKVKQNVVVAQKTLLQKQSSLQPAISSTARASHNKSGQGTESDSYSIGLSVRHLLYDADKTGNQLEKASFQVKNMELDYQIKSTDIRYQLRQQYIALLKAQSLEDIYKSIAARRQKQRDLIQLRYEAGREHQGALLEAKANFLRASTNLKNTKREIALIKSQIARFLEIKIPQNTRLNDNLLLPSANAKPIFRDYILKLPASQKSDLSIEIAQREISAAKADFWPTVYANGSYSYSDNQFFPEDNSWSYGLSMSLPIWDGNARDHSLSRLLIQHQIANLEKQIILDQQETYLEERWTRLTIAIDQLAVQSAFLDAAKVRVEVAELQYTNGLINYDSWMLVENDLANREKAIIESLATAMLANANWIRAKGGTLENDL